MNIKDLEIDEIEGYIQAELKKGRQIREIVRQVAEERDDVTILSHDLKISEQQIIESVKHRP